MARKRSELLTDGEQRIMGILWDRGECSVKSVANALLREKPAAYTTVQTMCRILAEKDYVDYRKEGRAFVYRAKMTRTEARRNALKSLMNRFFGGSPELLAQHLIQETGIDLKGLEVAQKQMDESG